MRDIHSRSEFSANNTFSGWITTRDEMQAVWEGCVLHENPFATGRHAVCHSLGEPRSVVQATLETRKLGPGTAFVLPPLRATQWARHLPSGTRDAPSTSPPESSKGCDVLSGAAGSFRLTTALPQSKCHTTRAGDLAIPCDPFDCSIHHGLL